MPNTRREGGYTCKPSSKFKKNYEHDKTRWPDICRITISNNYYCSPGKSDSPTLLINNTTKHRRGAAPLYDYRTPYDPVEERMSRTPDNLAACPTNSLSYLCYLLTVRIDVVLRVSENRLQDRYDTRRKYSSPRSKGYERKTI